MKRDSTAKPQIPISPETMKDALMEADDFGHEMRVRTLVEHKGARVNHGWSYVDPALGKARQFDLRCELRHQQWPLVIQLPLECKNLHRDAPLIVTGTTRTAAEAFHDFVASGAVTEAGTNRRGVYRSSVENRNYPRGGFVGKSVVRLQRNGDGSKLVPMRERESDIYERWAQAVASADQLCKEALSAADEKSDGHLATVIIPGVVVPDGTLWTAQYDNQGSCGSGPIPSPYAALFLNHQVEVQAHNYWMKLSHVHFWTVSGLKHFLERLREKNANWAEWFPANSEPYQPPIPR